MKCSNYTHQNADASKECRIQSYLFLKLQLPHYPTGAKSRSFLIPGPLETLLFFPKRAPRDGGGYTGKNSAALESPSYLPDGVVELQ